MRMLYNETGEGRWYNKFFLLFTAYKKNYGIELEINKIV